MEKLAGLMAVMASALALVGCGDNSFAEKPRQREALKAIWTDTYGMASAPPQIEWVEGDRLTCVDDACPETGFCFETVLGCRAGLSWSDSDVIQLSWPAGTTSFRQTAITHETCHLSSLRLTGDGDANHVGPCFRDPGEDLSQPYSYSHGRVAIAQDNLAAIDL